MTYRSLSVSAVCLLFIAWLSGCDCGGGTFNGNGNGNGNGPHDPDCIPKTCQELGKNCGNVSDTCGGTIFCGTCNEPETCGGRGIPGICAIPCTPEPCPAHIECGLWPDGCGDFHDCGRCEPPEVCGGQQPSKCGIGDPTDVPPCNPLTCADQGVECGPANDGCGDIIECGECSGEGEICGGGGPSICGVPPCTTLLTCADVGAECGRVGDGCGGLTEVCGTCTPPETCGGGGVLYSCGSNPDGPTCTGPWCGHQVACPPGQATSVRGKVYAPNAQVPLANAEVFVPNEAPHTISDGISCLRCSDRNLDDFLVAATTGSDGSFVLENVPADIKFPLVVQVGKWRRTVEILAVSPCTTVDLSPEQTRLPRNKNEGNIPRIAISTGAIDGLECVLHKAGVDTAEFTRPGGTGRIHLYRANGAWPDQELFNMCRTGQEDHNTELEQGGYCISDTPHNCANNTCREALAHNLYADQARLNSYDVVIFACEASSFDSRGCTPSGCWGSSYKDRSATVRDRIRNYVNSGGRLFLSHWSFDWLWNESPPYQTDPLHTTSIWNKDGRGNFPLHPSNCVGGPPCISQAFVDNSFDRGQIFSEWLDHVHASTTTGVLTINEPRANSRGVNPPGQRWVYTTQSHHGQDSAQQFTFNTPVGSTDENMCGRVAYSAFHVTTGWSRNHYFPTHCSGQLTAQEKVLLFMLFDLAACLAPDNGNGNGSICNPHTCAQLSAECGLVGDGCGGEINCGTCPPGETCGGGGIPFKCGSLCEARTSCEPHQCGYISDGCGGVLNCGTCPPGLVCRGGPGIPNVCVGGGCTPQTCHDWNAECGQVPDGCGGLVHCGDCEPGFYCAMEGDARICKPIG